MNTAVQVNQKSAQLSSKRASELQDILTMGLGDKRMYFEGSLAAGIHHDKDLKLFAEVLRDYQDVGVLTLTQKRISDGVYEYYVARRQGNTEQKYTPPQQREARVAPGQSQVWRI